MKNTQRNTVKPCYFKLLMQLQAQNEKMYSWAEIGRALNISGTAVRDIFLTDHSKQKAIRFATWGRLLDFFEAEGMPLSHGDLFVTEKANNQED